jgi:hypothetical protein
MTRVVPVAPEVVAVIDPVVSEDERREEKSPTHRERGRIDRNHGSASSLGKV